MKLRRIACLVIVCCILFSTAAPAMAAQAAASPMRVMEAGSLYAGPGSTHKALGKVSKGALVLAYEAQDNFTLVWATQGLGYMETRRLKADGDAKPTGVLLLEAATSIKSGNDSTLSKAGAGELLEVLYADSNNAIVRQNKTIGILPIKNAKLFDNASVSTGTAEATAKITLYSGPGSKYQKLGSLKKGENADVLGAFCSYTLLRAGNVIGLAPTKSLKIQSEVEKGAQAPLAEKGAYVFTPKAAYVYASAKAAKASYQMQAGTVLRVVKKDGDWLQVEVPGLRAWIEAKNVKASPVVPGLSIDGFDSSQYNQDGLELIALVNIEREARGASPLKVDPVLMKAAEIRARELEISFTHLRPNGLSPSSIDFSIRSENMGRGRGANDLLTAEQALKAFKGSSVHWANAMNKNYTRSGAAYVQINSIKYWVQLFG